MSPELTALDAEVTRNKTVVGSAVVLIRGIADRIANAGGDPVKLTELTASLNSSANDLASAVAENTPADPA